MNKEKIIIDNVVYEHQRREDETEGLEKVIIIKDRDKYLFGSIMVVGALMFLSFSFGLIWNNPWINYIDKFYRDSSFVMIIIIIIIGVVFRFNSSESYYKYEN